MGHRTCTICNEGSPLLGEETKEFTQRRRRQVRNRHLGGVYMTPGRDFRPRASSLRFPLMALYLCT